MGKLTTYDVAVRVDLENLDYAILHYFGRELGSDDVDLNAAWRVAYDALKNVEKLLPPIE